MSPANPKVGLDDWFAQDPSRTKEDLLALAGTELRRPSIDAAEHQRVADVEEAPASPELIVPLGYELGAAGVVKITTIVTASGEIDEKRVQVAPAPLFVAGRLVDVLDGGESLVLCHRRAGRWQNRIEDRACAMDARQLVRTATYGLPVTSKRAGGVVEYLEAFEIENVDRLPVARVSSQMGWQGRNGELGFLLGRRLIRPGADAAVDVEAVNPADWGKDWVAFRGSDVGDEQLAAGFVPGGSYEGWRAAVASVPAFPRVMLVFYASFVPPLLGILGAPNFVVDMSNRSSTGKTTALRVAASVWGIADEREPNSAMRTWDATRVWIERASAVMNGLPLILDDTKRARHPRVVAQTIYDVSSGRGRGRGSKQGLGGSEAWRTVLISTGEDRATGFGENGGAYARTITLWGAPFGRTDETTARVVKDLNLGLKQHHGHAGAAFVGYLAERRSEWPGWREMYHERRAHYLGQAGADPVTGRMADYFAAIDVAARLAHDGLDLNWGYEDPIEPLWHDLASEAAEADRSEAALAYVVSWAHRNAHLFWGRHRLDREGDALPPAQGWAGRWDAHDRWEYVGFFPDRLRSLLREFGFEPDSVVRAWRDRGWLMTQKDRLTKQVRIAGEQPQLIAVRREAAERETETAGEPG